MSYKDEPRADQSRRSQRREWRRKERILHTRISEELEEDLRRAAEELRVPVSNLVRNVLEEAVTVVEAVSDEFGGLIDDVVGSAEEVAKRFKQRHGGRWTQAARAARARADRPRDAREPERDESSERPPSPRPSEPRVLGWQPLVLNDEQRCACGRTLPRGSQAHVALTAAGLSEIYRCADCIGGLGH